jgi:DNA-directed RNA polymerase specialized sigma subunit
MTRRNALQKHEKSAPVITDPDLVDRIFDYLLAEFPHIAGDKFAKAKQAVRAEFRGEEVYIASRAPTERQQLAMSVLSMFNGRNASEVARRLGIGRATVYRIIKQRGPAAESLTFPGNETGSGVASDDSHLKPKGPNLG